jgi:starch synthase
LLQQRGMNNDFSWQTSAEKYVQLYRSIPGLDNA